MNDLATLLLAVAQSLEDRDATASAGLVRQAARHIAELEALVEPRPPGTCDGCGTVLPRARTGRPRRWCGNGRCAGAENPAKTRALNIDD